MAEPLTAPDRWEPDAQMVAAVLSSPKASRKLTELSAGDRAWLVAGLTRAGVTAQEIADRLGCSLRLVRAVRAENITQMAVLWQESERAAADELRIERGEHALTRRELSESCARVERLQTQLDQLVKKLPAGEPIAKCYRGHSLVDDDAVYRHGGRDYCRECNRENTRTYRKRNRKRAELQRHSVRVSARVHVDAIASAS